MNDNDILRRRTILDLEMKDLLKDMNFIDGKGVSNSEYTVSSMSELEFLEKEIELIKNVRARLENIFKE